MKIVTLICLGLVAVSPLLSAHEGTDGCDKPSVAAVVVVASGECSLREKQNGDLRKLKVGQELTPGQAIQADKRGRLVIKFCATGAEKEIKQHKPKWYTIPNTPSGAREDGFREAGRKKK